MYLRCDDAAEAREVVRWAKFAPLGTGRRRFGKPRQPVWNDAAGGLPEAGERRDVPGDPD